MSFHFLILFKIIFVLKKYDIFLVFFNDFNVLIYKIKKYFNKFLNLKKIKKNILHHNTK
jgi:hypothetical protein